MTSLLGWTFFGLTQDYRAFLFKQIHQIVFHGNGGYSWPDIYNMPIWLRRYTFEEIKEYNAVIQENANKSTEKKLPPQGPDIQPSFSSKRSKN